MGSVRRVTIIGGGLAGLATANALVSRGFAVDVFESAGMLGEIGAGINISFQAVKALRAIGIGDQAVAVARQPTGIFTRDMQTGEKLYVNDMAAGAARFGAPYCVFHRADLLNVLAGGLDPACLHLGHKLVKMHEHDGGATLHFANGGVHEAEILIAADGVRSVVRQALYGDDHPTYTGQMVWRALLNGDDVPADILEPTGHIQWTGPGCHVLGYYLRNKEVINIVTQSDTDNWVDEGWSTPGDPDAMRASFPDPEPRLKTLLAAVTNCSKWGLFTRPLTDNWGRGRIQLIGDAAHAMLPNAGQGAGQAFEDAYTLARWLEAEPDAPEEAFANFRRVRIPRVHGIQKVSFANARFKHLRDRDARKALLESPKGATRVNNLEWVWGYDPVEGWNKDPVVPEIEGYA
jgi:salicylate hydroxylase